MSSQSSSPLVPTWSGYVASTLDALVLIQGTFDGILTHVPRRPHDRERQELIKSGSIFIYEEHASGIKRWTDGVSWSPSRILGNFLIYRELDKPFAPGEKKRALKKKRSSPAGGIIKTESTSRSSSNIANYASTSMDMGKDTERSLIGSLTDSYEFKSGGLVKKTISITHRGVPHHLVSYYSVEDVMAGRLITPSRDPQLRGIVPHMDLMTAQNFRSPIDELEYGIDGNSLLGTLPGNSHDFGGASGSLLHRAWSNTPIHHASSMQGGYATPQYQLPHNAHTSYFAPMNSSLSGQMTSPMPPPLQSSSISSMSPSMQSSMSTSMPPSMQSSIPQSLPSSMTTNMPSSMASPAPPLTYAQHGPQSSYAWMPEIPVADGYWDDRAGTTARGGY